MKRSRRNEGPPPKKVVEVRPEGLYLRDKGEIIPLWAGGTRVETPVAGLVLGFAEALEPLPDPLILRAIALHLSSKHHAR